MKSKPTTWGRQAFLDVLRPAPTEFVDIALLSTYSCDLVVVTTVLLALAGRDGDEGSESRMDLADAFDRLKDRVAILHHDGRIAPPSNPISVMKLLDSFMRPVKAGETASWHPKIALVRYVNKDNTEECAWRLWIGSRNLTRSTSWEMGLLLQSTKVGGQEIAGVAELASNLAKRASLPNVIPTKVNAEVGKLRWKTGAGIKVEDIRLWDLQENRSFPKEPPKIEDLVIISPFLDGGTVSHFGNWGTPNTNRVLVSTLPELQKLAAQVSKPLKQFAFGVRYLERPDDELIAIESPVAAEGEVDFGSLHAKVVGVKHSKGWDIWMGSANITGRGISGPNAEVIAHLKVDPSVAEGLISFRDRETIEVTLSDLAGGSGEQKTEFEISCDRLAATWNIRQSRQHDEIVIFSDVVPHSIVPNAYLTISHIGSTPTEWPIGASCLQISIPVHHESALLAISVKRDEEQRSWVQVAPIQDFDREMRDRTLMGQYLDKKTFLAWLRSLLDGTSSDGGGNWDGTEPPATRKKNRTVKYESSTPSLEQLLRAYVRDPQQLVRVDRLIREYMGHIREQTSDSEAFELNELYEIWPIVGSQLLSNAAKAGK